MQIFQCPGMGKASIRCIFLGNWQKTNSINRSAFGNLFTNWFSNSFARDLKKHIERLVPSKQDILHWNRTLWKTSFAPQLCSAPFSELFLLSLSFGGFHLVITEDIQMCTVNLICSLKGCPLHTHMHDYCCQLQQKSTEFCKASVEITTEKAGSELDFHPLDRWYVQKDFS